MASAEVLLAGRWLLGIVLIMAGIGKLSRKGRESTMRAVGNYRVLPRSLSRPVAAVLPGVEISLACLLLAGVFVTAAAGCTAVLLGTFTVVVAWHVAHGRRFGCGCRRSAVISWKLAAGDATLSAVGILIALGHNNSLGGRPGPSITTGNTTVLLLVPLPLLTILVLILIRVLREAAVVLRAASFSMPAEEF